MTPFELPLLSTGFVLFTFVTLYAFYRLTGRNRLVLIFGLLWLALHAGLSFSGFYEQTDTWPPRLAVAIIPMLIMGLVVGFGRAGASLREKVELEKLHYLHAVRIIVEVVFLHGLYSAGYVAEALTYAGRNFDVVAGVTGPMVGWLVFRRKRLSRRVAFSWNVFGIFSLAWTVAQAVLSAPTSYQLYGLEQPTVAIFYFPYVWLPALVAPLMIWAHFMALKLLSESGRQAERGNTKG